MKPLVRALNSGIGKTDADGGGLFRLELIDGEKKTAGDGRGEADELTKLADYSIVSGAFCRMIGLLRFDGFDSRGTFSRVK